jgi:outer membrane protein
MARSWIICAVSEQTKWRLAMRNTKSAFGARGILVVFTATVILWPWHRPLIPAEAALARYRPDAATNELPISLAHSVVLALQNNMEVKVERLTPLIREEEVRREAGAFFAPRMSFEASADRSQKPAGSVLAGAEVATIQNLDVNAGVWTRSITGGVVSFDFRNKRLETNSVFQLFDPQYTADLALSLTHPLLKNFGIGVNAVRIKVAQNNVEISKYQLRARVMNLVVEVQQTYWDLVLAANDLATRRQSLDLAQHLQRRTGEMVTQARLPAIALLQAKTAVLEREIDVVAAENAFEDAQARLKALLNLEKVLAPAEYTLVPTDLPLLEPKMVSVSEGLKSAREKRPELFQARLDRENRFLAVKFAQNQRLPELNFVGSIGLSGLAGTPTSNPLTTLTVGGVPVINLLPDGQTADSFDGGYTDALGKLFSGNFVSYKVGLSLQIPLGNEIARSEVAKARLEVEKSKMTLETLEQNLALEVEGVARGVNSRLKTIEGARALRDLVTRKLEMAQEGLELGVSSVTDVLEAQKNLSLAQRDELKTVIEYNKMLTLWEKTIGVGLERFHIEL